MAAQLRLRQDGGHDAGHQQGKDIRPDQRQDQLHAQERLRTSPALPPWKGSSIDRSMYVHLIPLSKAGMPEHAASAKRLIWIN